MKKRVALVIGVGLLLGAGFVLRALYQPFKGYSGRQIVDIPRGSDAFQIARLLVSRGILRERLPFLVLYGLGRFRYHLEAGEYLFNHPLRPLDVYRQLIYGHVYLVKVVVPEGSNRFDMARIYHQRLGISRKEFLAVTLQARAIRDLDPQAPSLEGYLFPDTYRFPRDATVAQVVASMLNQFRKVYQNDLARKLPSSGLTLHQAVTLASLVERETPKPSERPIVAQVFELRLEIGMALESDPTVFYAEELAGHPVRTLTEPDLKFDSPYNTYAHAGLPPGPICSPGLASLEAVLCPASTDYLYFVSNIHGGHVFARTLAQHERNVLRYRRQLAALHRLTNSRGRPKNRPASSPSRLRPRTHRRFRR